jgi:transposase
MIDTAGRGSIQEHTALPNHIPTQDDNSFRYFAGIDWGSEQHRVCLLDAQGSILGQRWIEHSGSGLAELALWLRQQTHDALPTLAAGIEVPRGAMVETLIENGVAVFAINPKQLDRFRDRYSPAGAKDDSRDAFVLADSLRTDRHCFRQVQLDSPAMIRLRELSRLEDELGEQFRRDTNRLRDQFQRFFPQLLQLSDAADQPWIWDLFETAPSPRAAARLTPAKIARLLGQHRIRRLDAQQVRAILRTTPLTLAPGAAEAAIEHALLVVPRLRLLHRQRADLARRIQAVLDELTAPAHDQGEHRDAAILLSLPGLGRKIAATMLSEAAQAIADRDYHALRSYSGAAPVTQQSGKRKLVIMRRSVNLRLRNALYHWARISTVCDPGSKKRYVELRARGHSHGRALRTLADRWLRVLVSMLRHHTLYDPQLRPA